jgi:hypothetical protein
LSVHWSRPRSSVWMPWSARPRPRFSAVLMVVWMVALAQASTCVRWGEASQAGASEFLRDWSNRLFQISILHRELTCSELSSGSSSPVSIALADIWVPGSNDRGSRNPEAVNDVPGLERDAGRSGGTLQVSRPRPSWPWRQAEGAPAVAPTDDSVPDLTSHASWLDALPYDHCSTGIFSLQKAFTRTWALLCHRVRRQNLGHAIRTVKSDSRRPSRSGGPPTWTSPKSRPGARRLTM